MGLCANVSGAVGEVTRMMWGKEGEVVGSRRQKGMGASCVTQDCP